MAPPCAWSTGLPPFSCTQAPPKHKTFGGLQSRPGPLRSKVEAAESCEGYKTHMGSPDHTHPLRSTPRSQCQVIRLLAHGNSLAKSRNADMYPFTPWSQVLGLSSIWRAHIRAENKQGGHLASLVAEAVPGWQQEAFNQSQPRSDKPSDEAGLCIVLSRMNLHVDRRTPHTSSAGSLSPCPGEVGAALAGCLRAWYIF